MTADKDILNGLVLAGGKSSRMGLDKAAIQWHGTEQQHWIALLLETFCNQVYYSRRKDQLAKPSETFQTINDISTASGPLVAILSAFNFSSNAAWLVIACDLPLLDKETLEYLVTNRDKKAIATTFSSPFDGLPEPLITIWEPKSYPILNSFQSNGYTCPRKVLIKSEGVHILTADDPNTLMNVNTPEDFEKAKQILLEKNAIDQARKL